MEAEWRTSETTQESLEKLVFDGVLPDAATAMWWAAAGEQSPTPTPLTELVVFDAMFLRGLGVPLHPFLRGLLFYYGLELCHLNPNSILHISIFINLCEAFLGIDPHFNLFCHLFCVKPHPGAKSPHVVGGAGIQLREGVGDEYIQYDFPSDVKGWRNGWFYIGNHAPSISTTINRRPVPSSSWTKRPPEAEMDQVTELLQLIGNLKAGGLNGVGVAANFVLRRTQPAKERAIPAYEYAGKVDITREGPEQVIKEAAIARLGKFFVPRTPLVTVG
ncbi:unnamed protein product [Urochloa humidicola]